MKKWSYNGTWHGLERRADQHGNVEVLLPTGNWVPVDWARKHGY